MTKTDREIIITYAETVLSDLREAWEVIHEMPPTRSVISHSIRAIESLLKVTAGEENHSKKV